MLKTIQKNKSIRCKATGVTKFDRQKLIRQSKPGETLILRKDADNPFDKNAIAIYNQKGYQLGYIPKNRNKEIQRILDTTQHECRLKEINTYMGTTGIVLEINIR